MVESLRMVEFLTLQTNDSSIINSRDAGNIRKTLEADICQKYAFHIFNIKVS